MSLEPSHRPGRAELCAVLLEQIGELSEVDCRRALYYLSGYRPAAVSATLDRYMRRA